MLITRHIVRGSKNYNWGDVLSYTVFQMRYCFRQGLHALWPRTNGFVKCVPVIGNFAYESLESNFAAVRAKYCTKEQRISFRNCKL
jgi:hypothetical protein